MGVEDTPKADAREAKRREDGSSRRFEAVDGRSMMAQGDPGLPGGPGIGDLARAFRRPGKWHHPEGGNGDLARAFRRPGKWHHPEGGDGGDGDEATYFETRSLIGSIAFLVAGVAFSVIPGAPLITLALVGFSSGRILDSFRSLVRMRIGAGVTGLILQSTALLIGVAVLNSLLGAITIGGLISGGAFLAAAALGVIQWRRK